MNGRLAFNLLLLAAAAYFVWSAFGYELAARRIPILIGVLVLALQAWVTIRELRFSPAGEGGKKPPADEGRRVATMCGWLALYFLLFTLLGTLLATLGFVFLFLVQGRKLAWWGAAVVSGGVSGTIWLVFVHLMRFELYPGLVFGGTLPPL